MPLSLLPWANITENPLLQQELDYNVDQLRQQVDINCQKFNAEQNTVYTTVMDAINTRQDRVPAQCWRMWENICV